MRFKVRSEVMETLEESDMLHTRYETYISCRARGIGIWHKVEACIVNADEYPSPQTSVRRVVALYWELDK